MNTKQHPYFKDFIVSDCGKVFRTHWRGRDRIPREIKQQTDTGGYKFVAFSYKAKKRCVLVHLMVIETFVGDRPAGYQASHLDGNKENNSVANLAWETISENNQRKKKHGTERLGENCPHSKLTTGAVIKIRKHYALTMKKVDIARMYGVSESAINAVINHRSWRHV